MILYWSMIPLHTDNIINFNSLASHSAACSLVDYRDWHNTVRTILKRHNKVWFTSCTSTHHWTLSRFYRDIWKRCELTVLFDFHIKDGCVRNGTLTYFTASVSHYVASVWTRHQAHAQETLGGRLLGEQSDLCHLKNFNFLQDHALLMLWIVTAHVQTGDAVVDLILNNILSTLASPSYK